MTDLTGDDWMVPDAANVRASIDAAEAAKRASAAIRGTVPTDHLRAGNAAYAAMRAPFVAERKRQFAAAAAKS